MMKRIQAYFRTEDEAQGAKTSLIAYNVDVPEVSELTDTLGRDRNILFPILPLNNSSMAAGAAGAAGSPSGNPAAGAVLAPGLADSETSGDAEGRIHEDQVREAKDVDDRDLDDLRYVMELKVPEAHFNEVIQVLRGKHAFVEVFE
ncbi:hypothetical protein J7E73_06855 [Paenibacillus albidus]|uniref:hypothetical protein n=1 Tax=Paenibacillus albidus TaxID=2041023 RepID=UPI001BEBA085|nr:hypothetical protein [Paenibacillus albidus]MBT2288862.1 hypothetical protein [Paenibacillus albidus]